MGEINKNSFVEFKTLFEALSAIVNDKGMTWEEKHKAIFSEPLANRICVVGMMAIPDVQSSDKVEVETFYTAVYHKYSYLEVYLGVN